MGCFVKGLVITIVLVGLLVGELIYITKPYHTPVPQEYLQDHYWGKKTWKLGDAVPKDNPAIRPFTIKVEQSVLDDLKDRLNRTRIQDSFPGTNFEYGMRSDVLMEFTKYWMTSYDWRRQEKHLNSFPNFKTQIEGLDVHFVHIKSSKPNAIPLILVHGWSGSYIELLKLVPKLKSEFELVIPSLPGYSFSEASYKPGLHIYHIGRIFKKLMNRLGHDKFMYHGGDWGSVIGRSLARTFPDSLLGYHTTMPVGPTSLLTAVRVFASEFGLSSIVFQDEAEISRWKPITTVFSSVVSETGYFHIQATKPDTIGVALNNDPAGLAAYLLEKFSTLTNKENLLKPHGGLKETFSMDELLTNIMLYWVNGCITSSVRIYKESFFPMTADRGIVTVPTVALVGKHEVPMVQTATTIKDSYSNVLKYTSLDHGGHYLALELPDTVAKDLIDFAQMLQQRKMDKQEL